ncbi:MAG: TonB-dependent receptor [Rikenellaceae bacterium]
MKRYLLVILILSISLASFAAKRTFSVSGKVVNDITRQPLSYVAVSVDGQPQRGAVTNIDGEFTITGVEPGIFRLVGQSIGYEVGYSPDVQISATTQPVEIRLVANSKQIDTIVVRPSLFRKMVESPVSLRRIGSQQIEKSPGANRDVSRIVQSYPGVSFSPSGYRNDLIVRGGSPSENKFYVDGIEIPNINHFSTQGASGGPVSILNADLIREIDFYTSAFPVQRSGALSSVLDVKLRDGDPDGQQFKVTLGASEASLSGSGHFSDKTTYLFSIRQSYLQVLFKMIGLPFLPNFIDGQVKIKHEISPKDEILFLGLMGLDDMTLNEEGTTETSEYILGYLPQIEQQTFTTGLRYRHYSGWGSYSFVVSHSYLNDLYTKYQDNDESDPENLNLKFKSRDQKTTLRNENKSILSDKFTLTYGALAEYTQYNIDSYTRYSVGENYYDTSLNIFSWGMHVGAAYKSNNERLTASFGTRVDANNFSSDTQRFWEQFSPRATASYALKRGFSLSAATGLYYAMPPLTALSYREDGVAVNADLSYIDVSHYTFGVEWQKDRQISLSMEGFYKLYDDLPVSVVDDIPLADLGDDYGTVGNEYLLQTGHGRAYGLEFMGQWQIPGKLSLVGSLTLFKSEYATSNDSDYRPSSWDNRMILNASGTYFFKNGWSAGAKVSAIGGSPYTPYDVDYSSQIINWDVSGQPSLNYSLYNTERTDSYAQIDLRVDKTFYFNRWMLGLYIDLQNAFISKFEQQDIPVSTGEIDPNDPSRYVMKYLNNVSGTMLPTFGITAQF